MTQINLTPAERRALKASAHHLNPVVLMGSAGLTPAVTKEVDAALKVHELIKVRVAGDDRVERAQIFEALAEQLGAACVQHIGKLLVLWRPRPDDTSEKTLDPDRMPGPKTIRILKHSSQGGQKPEIKTVKVLGNERITAGGIIKRAKPKLKSVKKAAQR
jgi:putative YhbY family RNA-binding protein